MAEKIDELQLGISSDAQNAINQLGKLSTALNTAAEKADLLSQKASGLNTFATGLKNLANTDTDKLKKVASRLRSLSKIDLSNLENKNIDIGMSINGDTNAINNIANLSSALKGLSKLGGLKLTVGGDIFGKAVKAGMDSLGNSIKKVLSGLLSLSGKGVSALGSFLGKLGMIPTHTNNVNRMALTFGNLLRAVLPFYGIRGVFDWLKESVGLGSSIVEIQNVIDTAFGSLKKGYSDISGYTYNWAKTTKESFGVSELAAMRYAGKLQSIFNSSGFDASEELRNSAAKMTTDLVERAGDIASFYDITVDEAMTKIQSGIVGMSRPLRSLGINLSVANLESYALSQGITTSWKSMDQATQMALRYSYILEASQYAAGDFQRTQLSLANQLRMLSVNFNELSTVIGQGFVSALAPVIGWLNALIVRLIQAANAFKLFMWTLFGKPLSAARGVVDELLGSVDDSADAVGDLGSGAGGAADGLGSAGSAAKELKKQLTTLPFDQLNQLAKDTDSAGSGGSGGSGGGGVGGVGGLGGLSLLPDLDEDLESSPAIDAINRWAARLREAFEKQQWANLGRIIAEGINTGFQYIYDILDWNNWKPKIVDGFIVPFQTTLNSMMAWIDWDLIGQTFARGLNDIVYILRAWITGFEWREYGNYFAEGMNSLVNGWDADAFGRLIADKFKMAWDMFGGWVEDFNFKSLGGKLKIMVQSGIDELDPADMGDSLATFLNGIADTIITFFEGDDVASDVSGAFVEFANNFLQKLDSKKLATAIESIKSALKTALSEAIKGIDKDALTEDLKTVLSELDWGLIGTAIAIKAAGTMAISLFGSMFKIAAAEAIKSALAGITLSGLAIGLATITASVLAIGAITIGGIALGEWIKSKGWGQIDTKGNKETAAQKFTQGQTRNQKIIESSGQNNAGQYTQTQTAPITEAPAVTNTTQKVTQFLETIFTGKEDKSYADITKARSAIIDAPYAQMIMEGVLTGKFKTASDAWHSIFSKTETKTANGAETGAYKSIKSGWHNWISQTILKTANSKATGAYVSIKGGWYDWISQWIDKTVDSEATGSYLSVKKGWFAWIAETILKTANGTGTAKYWDLSADYYGLKDKTINVHVTQTDAVYDLSAYNAQEEKMEYLRWERYHAAGGLFTGAVGFQVFGEAGDEAAIPLERKSTMNKIGRAIANAGGLGVGSNGELATEIAMKIAPIIMSAVSGQNERPINVNATLYTEDNEVLARAVNQGNRSLDKRYNPVAQYSY